MGPVCFSDIRIQKFIGESGGSLDPVSSWPAIAATFVALGSAHLLAKKFDDPLSLGRYASIDGLRGFLAFFVFLHHSCIWYFYLQSHKWDVPPSNLYTHLGQSSVALFFMITGFLFFSKLLDGRKKAIDWERLYVSRFLRLTPLYVFVVSCLSLLVFMISGWILNEPVVKLAAELVRWLGFTILGSPNINGVNDTFVMVAGVTWSLAYEWAFYFSLPLLAFSMGVRPPPGYVVLSLVLTCYVAMHPNARFLSFLGGITAAVLV